VVARRGGRPAFADMAWTRIAPWQDLCARFFDDPRTEHAGAITRITIHQASEPARRSARRARCSSGGSRPARVARGREWAEPCGCDARTGTTCSCKSGASQRPEGVAARRRLRRHGGVVDGRRRAQGDDRSRARERRGDVRQDARCRRPHLAARRLGASRHRATRSPPANKGARVLERTLHRPIVDPCSSRRSSSQSISSKME
jgi:hypothetical protein